MPRDKSAARRRIGAFNVPDVVLIIVAIVVGTVFTQAFEFEAIRFLEGYWGPRRVVSFVADLRCRHHIKTRDRLGRRLEGETKRAVDIGADTGGCGCERIRFSSPRHSASSRLIACRLVRTSADKTLRARPGPSCKAEACHTAGGDERGHSYCQLWR